MSKINDYKYRVVRSSVNDTPVWYLETKKRFLFWSYWRSCFWLSPYLHEAYPYLSREDAVNAIDRFEEWKAEKKQKDQITYIAR